MSKSNKEFTGKTDDLKKGGIADSITIKVGHGIMTIPRNNVTTHQPVSPENLTPKTSISPGQPACAE